MTASRYCAMIAFQDKKHLRRQRVRVRYRDPERFLKSIVKGVVLAAAVGLVMLAVAR